MVLFVCLLFQGLLNNALGAEPSLQSATQLLSHYSPSQVPDEPQIIDAIRLLGEQGNLSERPLLNSLARYETGRIQLAAELSIHQQETRLGSLSPVPSRAKTVQIGAEYQQDGYGPHNGRTTALPETPLPAHPRHRVGGHVSDVRESNMDVSKGP